MHSVISLIAISRTAATIGRIMILRQKDARTQITTRCATFHIPSPEDKTGTPGRNGMGGRYRPINRQLYQVLTNTNLMALRQLLRDKRQQSQQLFSKQPSTIPTMTK